MRFTIDTEQRSLIDDNRDVDRVVAWDNSPIPRPGMDGVGRNLPRTDAMVPADGVRPFGHTVQRGAWWVKGHALRSTDQAWETRPTLEMSAPTDQDPLPRDHALRSTDHAWRDPLRSADHAWRDTPYAPPTTPGETRPTLHRPRLGIRPTLHRPRLGIRPTLHRPRLARHALRSADHAWGYALRSTDHAWGYALRSTDHAWGYALRSTDHAWGYALRSATHTTICPRHPGLSWSTRSHWQDKSPRSRRSG